MSVSTPERSPNARKKPNIFSNSKKNKKDKTNAVRDEVDQALNIDDMTGDKIRVKVLILWPNGEIYVRVPSSEESILLVKNIALKKWKVVSNTVFKHTELQPEPSKSLWQVLNKEFQEYSTSDCLLKGCSPEELIALSSSAVASSIIGGGQIFIYLCSQTIKTIVSKEINNAEHEYMNICPPPPIIELATALFPSRLLVRELQVKCPISELVV
jgi:hypothetical protein